MISLPEGSDHRWAWLCAGIVLTAIGLTIPLAESGFNDDWSYVKTALDLAQTGHLLYNGWSAAMLGAQAYWGALFIRLFGFSFLVVRLSVAPLAAGCAALLYVLHRRANLPPGLALFGTLSIALSPVFIPQAASFMTDIPGLFLFLVSIYGYVRAADVLDAIQTESDPPATWRSHLWRWLLLGLSAGLLGGTVRQTDWLVPLLAPVFLLARHSTFRRHRAALFPLTVCGLVALVGAMAFVAWFDEQPYAIQPSLSVGVRMLFLPEGQEYLRLLLAFLMQTLGALLLPLLVTLPLLYRRWLGGQRSPWLLLGTALSLTLFIWFLAWLSYRPLWVFHWLGNSFSSYPYLIETLPVPPSSISETLPSFVWDCVRVSVTALACGTLALCVAARFWPRSEAADGPSRDATPVVIGLLAVFSAAYVPLLLVKGLIPSAPGIWDRYLLPLLPLATMVYLSVFRRWLSRHRLPLVSWLLLALFAFYGVAQTHDYFAQLRARVTATQYLERWGVPRTRIMAGFEYDSWTQITVAGHYNDPRIETPRGIYIRPPQSQGFFTRYGLWRYTPVVHPDYVLALDRHPELLVAAVPPTEYRCWLPPFRRRLLVQVTDPALATMSQPPTRP